MAGGKLFWAVSLLMLAGLGLLAACGGREDEGGTVRPAQLTDPRSVPTATPWEELPDVIILEPGALTPLSGGGEEEEGGEETGGEEVTPGECGETYTVQAGDAPFTIAEKCGVSLEDLLEANPGIEPTSLSIGQKLNIPQ